MFYHAVYNESNHSIVQFIFHDPPIAYVAVQPLNFTKCMDGQMLTNKRNEFFDQYSIALLP